MPRHVDDEQRRTCLRGSPRATGAFLIGALVALCGPAAAADAEEGQRAELDKLRTKVANQVQLTTYNLLDELVYQWTKVPPFGEPTPVFLAGVTVPVGLGTGLEGLLENHLASLLLNNPSTRVTLSHCPTCTAVVVHSGPKGTVVSRGLDNPEALARIGGKSGRHGLYIDFAAEGAWLVLRARITKLTPDLPIVWSRTLSAAVGTPSLLRQSTALKSADAARTEYLDALRDRGPFTVPIRFGVRSYEVGAESSVSPPPIVWMQTGFEMALTQARSWTTSMLLGYAWLPDAYRGFMIQSRFSRLISGSEHSLTRPDIYLFLGGAVMTLSGAAIAPFRTDNFDQILLDTEGAGDTRATFGALHMGLELRVANRVGASMFLENMPAYNDSDRIGVFWDSGIIEFHSFGAEVSFCF